MKRSGNTTRSRQKEGGRPLPGEPGILYVVSTPIGNLEDITLRALRALREADIIAAENVSHTRVLCQHYGIGTPLTPYHQHNQKVKGPALVRKLKSGAVAALVSDAGTPGISDPGTWLVHLAQEEGIRVSPIPGPSALSAALSVSGLPTQAVVFGGFLPHGRGKRRKALRALASSPVTLVFYEAPHRIQGMLEDVIEILGDRETVVAREMTKVYEEIIRGPARAVLEKLVPEKVRGEFTVVIAGAGKDQGAGAEEEQILKGIKTGSREGNLSTRELARRIARDSGLPFRRVYRECIARKRAED